MFLVGSKRRGFAVIALGLALADCGTKDAATSEPPPQAAQPIQTASAPPSAAAPEPAPALKPPERLWKAPQPWQSRKPGTPPIPPPDLAPETWRAFVSQTDPIQIKTPLWQPLAPQDSVDLAMPPGSRFRCNVTPLSITADANDFGTKLKGWTLARTLTCSDDGWRSWTEYLHSTKVQPDGSREIGWVPQALLRERDPNGTIRHTFVVLRSDKEQREATTGPPKILPNVRVDED
jgi:hypothetical protein